MLPLEISFSRTKAPPVSAQLRQRARECIAHYVVRARNELGVNLPMPTCSFDLRGRTAGQAYYKEHHVRVNAVLLTENAEAFMTRTLPHEVAHLVAHRLHGSSISAHGPEWQAVMRAFGLEPSRCHSYDTSRARVGKTYRFRCSCRTFEVTARRARNAMVGGLRCRKCGTTLTWTGEVLEGGQATTAGVGTPAPAAPALPSAARSPAPVLRPALGSPGARTPGPPPSALRGATRAPTPAMLAFAQRLAQAQGVQLSQEVLSSFEACSRFLDQARQQPAATPAAAGAPAGDAPTEKQLSYAKSIAQRRGLTIAPDALNSRRALSKWIDENR